MALSHANSLKLYLSFPTVEWRKRLLIYFIWSEMAFIWISVRMKKAPEPVWSALLLSILSPLIILPVSTLHMWKRNLRKARSTLFKVTELVNHRIRTQRWVFWYHEGRNSSVASHEHQVPSCHRDPMSTCKMSQLHGVIKITFSTII